MKKKIFFCCCCVFLLIWGGGIVWGQVTTAQINGTLVDSTGAVLPGITVTATNPETAFTRSTQSNATGNYVLTYLTPGSYDLKIEGKGFATVVQKKVTLLVGQVLTLNFTMKPGTAAEIVNVTGEAPLIETGSSQIVGSVSPGEVKGLPLSDRNFAGLMSLVPGVRPYQAFDPTKTRSGNVSINGSDGRAVDYNVDGGDNKDNVIGGLVQNYTMEGIQEFNVVTDRYSAEVGRTAGAVVNVITKSGTNTLHGSAFGQFQTSSLFRTNELEKETCVQQGISDVGRCKAKYHRQHFGGSIGGPVVRDKFFFFGAFEQKREPGSLTLDSTAFQDLTTLAKLTQNFSGAPYAVPVTNVPFPYVDNLLTIKLDHKINDKQNMFYRYGREKWTNPNDQLVPFTTDESQTNTDTNQFHDFTIGHNYAISATKANSLNVHFQDFANLILNAPGRTFTYPIAGGGVATNPNFYFPDRTQVGINVNVPQETLIRKYQFRDDFSWVHNRHAMKFGGNWIYLAKLGGYFYSGFGYTVNFWNTPTDIVGKYASFYPQGISTPGAVSEILYNGGSGSTAQPPAHSVGLYYQDDFKATKRLTLNLGLRWDANPDFLLPQLRDSLTNSNRVIWALRQTLAANPSAPGTQAGMNMIRYIAGDTSLLTKRTDDAKEFQPRVGFAYDVTGAGKHVIRGGFGIARDQIFQNLTLWSIQQSQASIYQTVMDQTSSLAPPLVAPTKPCVGPLCTFRFGIDKLPSPGSQFTDLSFGAVGRITNPRITDPWSEQMSIGWAWQPSSDYAFSADYYHILGTHEERVLNANPRIRTICNPSYGGDPTRPECGGDKNARLMDAAFQAARICAPSVSGTECGAGRFAHIYEYSTDNRSLYDGINFQLKKRMGKRVQFQASYVLSWARSWGGFPSNAYMGSGYAVAQSQQFVAGEWARTINDERHRFTLSGIFNLRGGFELAPLFQAASARPYSFLAGADIDGDGRTTLDRVCVGSTVTPFNPITTPGCQMLPPNTLSGKPMVQLDLRTSRLFRFGERVNMRLSWEFFNLLNRSNFCNDYVENSSSSAFNTPLGFCGGPSGYGFSAAAIPSLHTQGGIRFEF